MTPLGSAGIDAASLRRLRGIPIGPGDKSLPEQCWGWSADDVAAAGLRLSDLPTPLVTLAGPTLQQNVESLAVWCHERGLALAPHGKTTMAPAVWSQQLDAGAVAITVATEHQAWVALSFGVTRVMIANSLPRPDAVTRIAAYLDEHPNIEVVTWVDSVDAVTTMAAALTTASRPWPVLVELGGAGGRTGARSLAAARDVAAAVARSDRLELRGTAGYEGVFTHGTDAQALERIRDYLATLADLHRGLRSDGHLTAKPWCTAGGSSYFEVVADVLGPLNADDTAVVLRPGAYVTHDDGFSARTSPLGNAARTVGRRLESAIHGWGRVLSTPEPGLALVDGGKRDWSYDLDLPVPQQIRRQGRVASAEQCWTDQLNDQHCYLRWPSVDGTESVGGTVPGRGELVRFGLSHPCTTFDKWRLLPVIDDPDAPDPVVIDVIRTLF